uniref:RING-type domain-containing protein n=1 Tax=Amphimedon queenslandica TaxID=400682 RepID=A0A1X7V608_AMPQE
MTSSKHQLYLDNHCRLCGKPFGKKTNYTCSKYTSIVELFGVDHSCDQFDIHPSSFCNSCYLAAMRVKRTTPHTCKNLSPSVEWFPHNEEICDVCNGQRRGRPKKRKHPGGRPSNLEAHIRSVTSHCIPHFSLSQVTNKTYHDILTCKLCSSSISDPVEVLPCQSLFCSSCLLEYVNKDMETFHCPGCSDDHVCTDATFTYISPVAEKMICNISVRCDKCFNTVKLDTINKFCDQHIQNKIECSDMLCLPLQSQPTTMEKKMASNVVTRLLHQSNDTLITLRTGGQPLNLIKLTTSSVSSGECSKGTIRRRSNEIRKIRERLSMGDSTVQMHNEIEIIPKEERTALMKEANFTVTIPPDQGLAMKADLNIPWNKLRAMR